MSGIIKALSVVFLFFIFFLLIYFITLNRTHIDKKLEQRIEAIQQATEQFKKQNNSLIYKIQAVRLSDKYIGYLAREQFGMKEKDEQIVEFIK